jgi:hypothetical protein
MVYYHNFVHARIYFFVAQEFGPYTILPKCMEIFQHFCDVFIPYNKIANFLFPYHTFNIALYGIIFQRLCIRKYFLNIHTRYVLNIIEHTTCKALVQQPTYLTSCKQIDSKDSF